MTTALITGITGQDGYYLTERLLAEGVTVHGIVRSVTDIGLADLPPQVAIHYGDLSSSQQISDLIAHIQPDEIYNLGGLSSVAASWERPTLMGQINGIGAVAIMEAARKLQETAGKPVRVLQASSAEIFGYPDQTPQVETTTIRPMNPYGASKAYAHFAAEVFRTHGLPVATVILYNHESPRRPESFVTRKITAGAARIAHDGGGTLALGNLDAKRDWGWAPDYVDAMIRAIRHPEPTDFVIATGQSHSVADFVRLAFARVGISNWQDYIEIDPQFVRPADAPTHIGDASKARRELGWVPSITFDELVARMVDNDVALLRQDSE